LLPSWDAPGITSIVHCRTPGAYRVFIIAFSACQADGQVLQRPAPRIGLDKLVLISQKAAQAAAAPQASSAELTFS